MRYRFKNSETDAVSNAETLENGVFTSKFVMNFAMQLKATIKDDIKRKQSNFTTGGMSQIDGSLYGIVDHRNTVMTANDVPNTTIEHQSSEVEEQVIEERMDSLLAPHPGN